LTCATVTVPGTTDDVTSIAAVKSVSGGVAVSGWALNPASPTVATNMAVQIGSSWYSVPTNLANTDAPAAVPGAGPNQGFGLSIALAPGVYSVCIWITEPSTIAANLGCTSVKVFATLLPNPIQRAPRG
jgi:hypothetical protein